MTTTQNLKQIKTLPTVEQMTIIKKTRPAVIVSDDALGVYLCG